MCEMKLRIHSQTSMVEWLKFGKDKQFCPTLYNGYNYLSMVGLNLIHGSKRGPWRYVTYTLDPQCVPVDSYTNKLMTFYHHSAKCH